MNATLLLLIISAICFFLAAVPIPWGTHVQLGWLGMFFWILTYIIGK